jgi:uncharacterized protein (TIGR00269 family)
MLAQPDLPAKADVALRLCSSAGEALPRDIGERWTAHFGAEIIDGIGSTEMLHIFLSNLPGDVRYGTTGKAVPGYQVQLRDEDGSVITGHNLDDEAATLLGNLLRWNEGMLARQRPSLPSSGDNLVRKCKPLYRLSERETAAYCVVRGIDYVVEECPLVEGNTGQELKAALDVLEATAPGTKAHLLFGFLERADGLFPPDRDTEDAPMLGTCAECGMPTTGPTCAFCRERRRMVPADGRPLMPIVAVAAPRPRGDA